MGQLVGAERPSVSHALARLSDAGLVTGRSEEWHLHGSAEQHLAFLKAGEGAKAISALTNGHSLPRV
jgi:hypothetical protein